MSIRQVIDYKKDLMSLYWGIKPLIMKFYLLRRKIEIDGTLTKDEKEDVMGFIDGELEKLADNGNGKSFIQLTPSPNR